MEQYYTILVIINTIVLLGICVYLTIHRRANNYIIALSKRALSQMGQASAEVRTATARTRIKEEHKGAFLDSLAAEIPFAKNVIDRMRDGGMGDNEILVMLSDPDILNGIVRVAQGAGVVVDSLKGLIGGGDKDKPKGRARQGEIPLIETKA